MVYELESGIYVYTGINKNNEDLIVRIKKGLRAEVEHVNKNGKSHVHQYNADGSFVRELLEDE